MGQAMSDPGGQPDGARAIEDIRTDIPHPARIYDYWLGGEYARVELCPQGSGKTPGQLGPKVTRCPAAAKNNPGSGSKLAVFWQLAAPATVRKSH